MGLGPMELVLIFGIALLVFGPSRLPGLGRSVGDAIRGFKKGIEGEEEKDAKRPEQISSAAPVSEAQKSKNKTEV